MLHTSHLIKLIKQQIIANRKQDIFRIQSEVDSPLIVENTTIKISQLPSKSSIIENDQLVFVDTNDNALATSRITFKNFVNNIRIDGGDLDELLDN
jgi:hypothetical protein